MKILITGVNGQLGSQLREISFKDHEIIGLKKNQFNLQDKEYCRKIILEEKFSISDSELFESKMNEFSINFNSSLDPITWIFDLLRASSNKDLNVNDFGVEILPAFSDLSLVELRDLINQEMLQLSEAHYYKFFNRAT